MERNLVTKLEIKSLRVKNLSDEPLTVNFNQGSLVPNQSGLLRSVRIHFALLLGMSIRPYMRNFPPT
jgi:hypothetical protein